MSAVSAPPEARRARRERRLAASVFVLFVLVLWQPALFHGKHQAPAVLLTFILLFVARREWRGGGRNFTAAVGRTTPMRRIGGAVAVLLLLREFYLTVSQCLTDAATPVAYKAALVVAANVAGVAFLEWAKEAILAWRSPEARGVAATNAPSAAGSVGVPSPAVRAAVSVSASSGAAAAAQTPQVVTLGSRTP